MRPDNPNPPSPAFCSDESLYVAMNLGIYDVYIHAVLIITILLRSHNCPTRTLTKKVGQYIDNIVLRVRLIVYRRTVGNKFRGRN